ncbi:hypothetical protein ABZP36_018657 [Zizania latifolia]
MQRPGGRSAAQERLAVPGGDAALGGDTDLAGGGKQCGGDANGGVRDAVVSGTAPCGAAVARVAADSGAAPCKAALTHAVADGDATPCKGCFQNNLLDSRCSGSDEAEDTGGAKTGTAAAPGTPTGELGHGLEDRLGLEHRELLLHLLKQRRHLDLGLHLRHGRHGYPYN